MEVSHAKVLLLLHLGLYGAMVGVWEEVPQEGRTLAVNPQTLFLHILLAPGKRKIVVRFPFKSPLPQKT